MNRGLIAKSLRELGPATAFFGLVLFAVEAVLAYVLPAVAEQFPAAGIQLKFFQTIVRAILGSDAAENLGPEVVLAIPWVHPGVLAVAWGHAIACGTRLPAGEVDRGTIDILLSLPVSRWCVHASEAAAWVASALAVLGLALAGNIVGSTLGPSAARLDARGTFHVFSNFICAYAAMGGAAALISSVSDRRGKAITSSFLVALVTFLLNYLGQFWEPARRVAFLSLLEYYRPLRVIHGEAWPWMDMLVLACVAGTTWIAAGLWFSRRDLSTV